MRRRDHPIVMARTAVLIAFAFGVWGCERPGTPSWDSAELRAETFTNRSPALVLGRPASSEARAPGRRWWYDRNDGRLNVGGDRGRSRVVDYEVRIRDRQHAHDDHVHDSYRRTVRTRERGRLVR